MFPFSCGALSLYSRPRCLLQINCSFPFTLFNCLATRLGLSQIRRSNIEMFVITGLRFCQRGTIIQRRAAGQEPDICWERNGKNWDELRGKWRVSDVFHHQSQLSWWVLLITSECFCLPYFCYLYFLIRNFITERKVLNTNFNSTCSNLSCLHLISPRLTSSPSHPSHLVSLSPVSPRLLSPVSPSVPWN